MPAPSLEYFIEIAKCLNISMASRKLHVTQQSLSAYLQRLESYYDVTLVERKPTLKLTKAGEIVLKAAEKIESIHDSLHKELSKLSRDSYTQKHLSIGIFKPNASQLMNFIPLVKFNKKYPLVSYTITEESNHKLWEQLRDGKLDMIISSYNPSSSFPNFRETILYDDNEFVLISDEFLKNSFPESYPECISRFSKGVTLSEFKHVPMLMHPADSATRMIIDQYFKDRNISISVIGESPDRFLTNTIVHNGMALGFCNRWILNFLKKDAYYRFPESVYAFPIVEPDMKRTVGILYRSADNYPTYFTDLIQMTRDNCTFGD